MALFSKKKKEIKESSAGEAKIVSVAGVTKNGLLKHVILNQRITEKSSLLSAEKNIYTFNVAISATKKDVLREILSIYKITPVDIRFVRIPRKKVFSKGKIGHTAEGKKALVALKTGDKIEFV